MKILLAAAAVSMALFTAGGASADVVGAHVGPLGVGIHVHHHGYYHGYYHHHRRCAWRHHHRVCW